MYRMNPLNLNSILKKRWISVERDLLPNVPNAVREVNCSAWYCNSSELEENSPVDSTKSILQAIYATQKPTLLKNYVLNWPAISHDDSQRQWNNLQALKNRLKGVDDIVVPVEMGRSYMSKDFQKVHVGLGSLLDYFMLPPATVVAAGTASADAESTENQTSDLPRVYWAQHDISEVSQLCNDIITPEICELTGKKTIYKRNIWFNGSSGSESPCHFDPFQNILCQLVGRKKVLLFAPEDSGHLYPSVGNGSLQPNTSLVDMKQPDFSKHPNFRTALLSPDTQQCVLDPGDALFIPYKWWHYCTSEEMSCSVNYWWL